MTGGTMPTVYLKTEEVVEVPLTELEDYLYENVEFALQEMKNYDI
jgi:hypothetical protein